MEFNGINNAKLLNQFIIKKLKIPVEENELKSISSLVLNHLFQLNKVDIILEKKIKLDQYAKKELEEILHRLNKQEPVQYVLGKTVFYGLEFKVTPDVLIPRPETEELVDLVIKENTEPQLKVLDIGTGSGCIAVALKKNLDNAEIFAVDVSREVLAIATENAAFNHTAVKFIHFDIMSPPPPLPMFDVIISNPPYVLEKEKVYMQENVLKYEPQQALFVPDLNPLFFYKRILDLAEQLLKVGGKIYFEINEKFGNEIAKIMQGQNFMCVEIVKDMQNKDRMVIGIKIEKPYSI